MSPRIVVITAIFAAYASCVPLVVDLIDIILLLFLWVTFREWCESSPARRKGSDSIDGGEL